MKAIIGKEFREQFKLSVLGIIVLGLLLAWILNGAEQRIEQAASQHYGYGSHDDLQPLLAPDFIKDLAFFCGIFAALLGWMQVRSERHRDLWAFLVHRPESRTRIFLAKTFA